MTKPRPPRPVRAWAVVGARGGMSPVIVNSERRFLRSLCLSHRGEYMVRVTLVPDGATSAEAEARKLRRLLRKVAPFVGWTGCPDGMRDEIDAALRRKGGSR